MSTSFSPSRSPGNARLQFGGVSQRLRSSSFKKPPEPLRRAVADCLSSSSLSHQGNLSTVASEAARTLRVRNFLLFFGFFVLIYVFACWVFFDIVIWVCVVCFGFKFRYCGMRMYGCVLLYVFNFSLMCWLACALIGKVSVSIHWFDLGYSDVIGFCLMG